MRWFWIIALLALAGCASKSDVDLFDEGAVRIDLSLSPKIGYRPLFVNFTAYLETKERSVEREIDEVKWVIRGPRGYEREIVEGSANLQNEDENLEGFFYMEYEFNIPGRYTIQLFLNDGEFASRPMKLTVLDRPDENPGRF